MYKLSHTASSNKFKMKVNTKVDCYCGTIRNTDKQTKKSIPTVLPAESDSDAMFCLLIYQRLIIDRSLVYKSYPQDRINTQVVYQFALAQVECASYCLT